MLAKLKEIQCADGLWHGNLLDPMSPNQPDTSGSGSFYMDLLMRLMKDHIRKRVFPCSPKSLWSALVNYVQESGKFNGVQPIGDSPKPFDNNNFSIPYGAGAFLLAASEVYKLND